MSPTEACTVELDGDEYSGANHAIVEVTSGNYTVNVPIRVWHPSLPINITLADPTLNPYEGYLLQCGPDVLLYEDTTVSARAVYTTDTLSYARDVTDAVTFWSSNTQVATVTGTTVSGKRPSGDFVTSLQQGGIY